MEKENDSVRWTADIVALRGETEILGQYSIGLALQKDNLIRLSSKYELKPGITVKSGGFWLGCQGGEELTGYYNIGERKIKLDSKKVLTLESAPGIGFTFFPGQPAKKFKIIPEIYSGVTVNTNAGRISFTPQDGDIELLLDLRGEKQLTRSEEYYGGTDFEKIDRLHLPQYKKCSNLIQNPSFEAGMRYWGYKSFGGNYDPESSNIYNIDTKNAKFGNNSMRIRALKTLSLELATFAIPVEPGKKYVLSFYAKGSLPEDLSVRLDGRATVTWWMFEDKKRPLIPITDEWKRYDVSFTPEEEFYSIYFQGSLAGNSKEQEGTIWLDGLQLEEEELTDYTEMPFSIQLMSSARGNFLDLSTEAGLKTYSQSKAGATRLCRFDCGGFLFQGNLSRHV